MTRQQLAASSIIAVAAGMAVVVWAAGRGTGVVPAAGVAAACALGLVFVAITMRYTLPTVEPRALFASRVAQDEGFAGLQVVLMNVFLVSGAMLACAAAVVSIAVTAL